jgi:nitroreductase
MKEMLNNYLKKIYYQWVARIRGVLLPASYKQEYDYFENLRGEVYDDLAYKEAYLRRQTHQIDKILTFSKVKKMESIEKSVRINCESINQCPGHDSATITWCKEVLSGYENIQGYKEEEKLQNDKYNDEEIETLSNIIESRRSIRSYKHAAISETDLHKILKAGLWAPTGCNRQTIEYLILTSTQDIEYCQRIAGEGYAFPREAPLVLVILVDPRNYPLPNHRHMAYLEGGAAIQNILLMAHALGIGSCWLFWNGTHRNSSGFHKKYNLAPWLLPVSMVCLGYAKIPPLCIPRRKDLLKSIHKNPKV